MSSVLTTARTPMPPPPSRARKRASKAGYWVAAAIGVASLLGGITWSVLSFVDLRHDIDRFARVAVSGQAALQLPGSTGRVLYYEGPGEPTLAMLDIRVSAPDGGRVAVHEYGGEVRYDAPDGVVGRAVGTFDTADPGTYVVSVGASLHTHAVVAIGPSIVSGSGGRVAAGAVVAVAGLAIGAAIAITTAVRRSRV
jgi:hypothetical protein